MLSSGERMQVADNLVKIQALRKRYFFAQALNGVDLQVKRGVILGLLGPNGSGKSSLLKIMAGLVRPSSGTVSINGAIPSRFTKAHVAYLPEVDYLYGWMTVREIIDFVAAFYRDWQPERADAMLRLMGLELHQKVGHLSKGKRALLKLLLAFSRRADLVLLDEPLSGIDPPTRAKILAAIVSEYRVGEQTIILSTHEVSEAESVFEEVVYLREGRVALQGAAEALREEHGCSINDLWEKVYQS